MPSPLESILRSATRDPEEPLTILTFPTHEAYQTNMAKTGHRFLMWNGPNIKPWAYDRNSLPENTIDLNPELGDAQLPEWMDVDLVLSQNKFGQFPVAVQIAKQLNVPLISLEHTLPPPNTTRARLVQTKQMRGDMNIFISEYSRKAWGWSEDEADVIHHGIDTTIFNPYDIQPSVREDVVLSVVNDWINRSWCCGFDIWRAITNWPEPSLPVKVVGDTPGLSEPTKSIEEIAEIYRTSRVFLNTSTVSPIPTALLEAMASGCAVVSTNNCMIPDIITHGKNGFLSNDPGELKGYCELLLRDDKMANALGEAARNTIIEMFNLGDFVENWNTAFLKVLGNVVTKEKTNT